MKIEGNEIAPSGKPRLKIYLGDEELRIMASLVEQAFRHTARTPETEKTVTILRSMNRTLKEYSQTPRIEAETPKDCVEIWFDGGTPCNIPSKGYGKGYGSFKVGPSDIVRLQFDQAMSANTAEIRTVTQAIRKNTELNGNRVWLKVVGDSQIALKWVGNAFEKAPIKVSKGSSELFIDSIKELYQVVDGYEKIICNWVPRNRMVELFGH